MKQDHSIQDRLFNKSLEAFILGIEIYNKPTIQYRVEGFSFFICNAWELMLKSYLIKKDGEKSVYFKDNPDRTISLENALKLVFTNKKDPLRINLEKIIELRNTSTHFITEEYEMIYIPLFQSCVINFSEKLMEFHTFDVTTLIPQNFLTLNVSMQAIESSTIIAKYPEEIAKKLITVHDDILELSTIKSPKFALAIEHRHFIVKDRSKATSLVGIEKNADTKVKIVKELKDPNQTHPYNMKSCIQLIKRRLDKIDIQMPFNQYVFHLFINYYNLKSNSDFCYVFKTGASTIYSYSQKTVDFIIDEIKKDPANIVQDLKERIKKR